MISYLHDPTSHLKKLVLNTIFSFYWCEEGKYMVRNTRRASTVCPDLSKVIANTIFLIITSSFNYTQPNSSSGPPVLVGWMSVLGMLSTGILILFLAFYSWPQNSYSQISSIWRLWDYPQLQNIHMLLYITYNDSCYCWQHFHTINKHIGSL